MAAPEKSAFHNSNQPRNVHSSRVRSRGRGRTDPHVAKALYLFGVPDLRDFLNQKHEEEEGKNIPPADPSYKFLEDPLRESGEIEESPIQQTRPRRSRSGDPIRRSPRGKYGSRSSERIPHSSKPQFIKNPSNILVELTMSTGVKNYKIDNKKIADIRHVSDHDFADLTAGKIKNYATNETINDEHDNTETEIDGGSFGDNTNVEGRNNNVRGKIRGIGSHSRIVERSREFRGRGISDFRGRGSDYRGRGSDFRGRGTDYRGRGSDFRGRGTDFSGLFRGRGGDFRGRGSDFKGRGGDYRGRGGDFRGRGGDFKGRGGDYRGRGGNFRGRNNDFLAKHSEFSGRDVDISDRDGDAWERDGDFRGRDDDFRRKDGNAWGTDGDFGGRDGDFRGRDGDFRGRDGDFRGRDGDFRGRDGDFRGRDGNYKRRGSDFRGRSDYRGRGSDFRGRGVNFKGMGEDFRVRDGHFKGKGGDFRRNSGDEFRADRFNNSDNSMRKGSGFRGSFRGRGTKKTNAVLEHNPTELINETENWDAETSQSIFNSIDNEYDENYQLESSLKTEQEYSEKLSEVEKNNAESKNVNDQNSTISQLNTVDENLVVTTSTEGEYKKRIVRFNLEDKEKESQNKDTCI